MHHEKGFRNPPYEAGRVKSSGIKTAKEVKAVERANRKRNASSMMMTDQHNEKGGTK